jgi:hypothetical protein
MTSGLKMSRLIFDKPDAGSLADSIVDILNLSDSTLTIFKQTAAGPSIMGDNALPFITEDPDPYRDLYRIGSFYCVAIGQGSHYNTGLFGPLPVLGSKYKAMVYSATVKDKETFDPRMKGWNYLIACFFFHESLMPVIHRKKEAIESLFENFFEKNKKLTKITNKSIYKLKEAIVYLIQEEY